MPPLFMRAVAAVVAGKMSKIDGEKKKGKGERERERDRQRAHRRGACIRNYAVANLISQRLPRSAIFVPTVHPVRRYA